MHQNVSLPFRSSNEAAGYDLFSKVQKELPPGKVTLIDTGICMEMPPGMYASVLPRSGLAAKQGMIAVTGTIDSDYRGEVKVMMLNINEFPVYVGYGDRIAQLVFHKMAKVKIAEVDELSTTDRGVGGFGSTGR
jgi:dUTP pyrophosphatase